jgi:hypothetical protein
MNIRSLALIFLSANLSAFEVETHGFMTLESYSSSILGADNTASAEVYFRLGFDRVAAGRPFFQPGLASCEGVANDPKQDAYIDPQPAWLVANSPDIGNRQFRCPQEYERASLPPAYRGLTPSNFGSTPELRLEAWMMRGVIREDDITSEKYSSPLRPDPDPWGEQDRPINHFYTPVANAPGTPLNIGAGALRWAMGEDNPLTTVSVPDPNRGNHFSYVDARRNFFLALTYKAPGATTAASTKKDSDTRQNLWAATMLSVGHVVHLLQDQASPQHSRAEPHNYVCRGFLSIFNAPVATRTFENFINYRVTLSTQFQAPQVGNQPNYTSTNACEEKVWRKMFATGGQSTPSSLAPWLRSGGSNTYPIPQFSIARKFFTTRANDGTSVGDTNLTTLNTRAGLGDYANRGFYTEGNMEGSVVFSYPFISPPRNSNDLAFGDAPSEQVVVPGKGRVKFSSLFWRVPDPVAPNYADPNLDALGRAPIVSYGQWGFLGAVSFKRRILTLNNYNQMADMLAPRAIAYSTGLINFFFRGKLEIEPTSGGHYSTYLRS